MIQKLIDAYELEREMYRKCIDTDEEIEKDRAKWDSGLWIRYKVFEDAITLAPTVDAEPVRHGHWTNINISVTGSSSAECSLCGTVVHDTFADVNRINYCPQCGAKMDEVGEDD